jgi:membrane-associated phospholipid phosphatase
VIERSYSFQTVFRSFQIHEIALITLGAGTMLALVPAIRSAPLVLLEVAAGTSLYVSAIFAAGRRSESLGHRIRVLASLAFAVWFYNATGRITPVLGASVRDGTLRAIDEAIFGQTPAVFCERLSAAWLTDLLSLCYFTYLLYLPMATIHAAFEPGAASRRFSACLFTGFAIGFAGYLLVPAVGPARAYGELFATPLPSGALGRKIMGLLDWSSSDFDVFPSLHVLITCILLAHDWTEVRSRFWIMLGPVAGLVVSTIYLRYHYGVDVLAGALLFLVLWQTLLKSRSAEVASGL